MIRYGGYPTGQSHLDFYRNKMYYFGMIMDLLRPHRSIPIEGDPDYWMEQNNLLYAWSESNLQYELAWWWYNRDDATDQLTLKMRRERPIPPGFIT